MLTDYVRGQLWTCKPAYLWLWEETNLAVCHLFILTFLNELELACFCLEGRGTRQGNSCLQTPIPSPVLKGGLLIWALFTSLLPNRLCASMSAGYKTCLNPWAMSRWGWHLGGSGGWGTSGAWVLGCSKWEQGKLSYQKKQQVNATSCLCSKNRSCSQTG